MKILTLVVPAALLATFILALTTNQGLKLNNTRSLYPATYLITEEDLLRDEDREPLTPFMLREREKVVKRRLNDALNWFVAQLRTFIFGLKFHKVAFRLEEQQLQTYFSEVCDWVESFKENNEFEKKINFARYFFLSMKNASEYLDYFNNEARSHELVRNIVKLNLRLLSLHTLSGLPNRKVPGFQDKVERLTRYVDTWYREFHSIPQNELSVRVLFESQVMEASKVLDVFIETAGVLVSSYHSETKVSEIAPQLKFLVNAADIAHVTICWDLMTIVDLPNAGDHFIKSKPFVICTLRHMDDTACATYRNSTTSRDIIKVNTQYETKKCLPSQGYRVRETFYTWSLRQ